MQLCYHCMSKLNNSRRDTCPVCGKSLHAGQGDIRLLNPGTLLQDKYIIGYPLGSGGFGITYIGWDRYLQRKVAIKEFYPVQLCHRMTDHITISVSEGMSRDRFLRGRKNFLEEARNIAALNDVRGVVDVLNYFEANGTAYMVMEYLEGTDVAAILRKSGSHMKYPWCRKLILSVLYTLRMIHARGVLHRDISPDNVFVTKDGIVKLIDFGAARNYTYIDNDTQEVVLKNGYSPIEQYSLHTKQGSYTDLYAVAAMFYQLLTGVKLPSAYHRMMQDTLIMPSNLGAKLPQQAEFAIMTCLNLDPRYRLQNASDFMEALDGKNFIPVYDAKWILPKERDVNGFLRGWRWIPLSARIAMGVSTGIILLSMVIGGILLWMPKEKEIHNAVSKTTVMPDLSGMTMEEAENKIKTINLQNGYHLSLTENEHIFYAKKSKNGKICSQSIPIDTNLDDKEAMTQIMDENLYYDENDKLVGTVMCDVYSAEELKYSDLSNKNAYEISKLIQEDINGVVFEKNEIYDKDKTYWEVQKISLKDGREIEEKQLNAPFNHKLVISKSSIDTITYYANSFYYWKKLPDFKNEYGSYEKLEKEFFDTYVYENETNLKPEGKNKISDLMIDDNFSSFTQKKGSILSQSIEAGKEYNSSKEELLKINVVGKSLSLTTPEGRSDAASVKAYLMDVTGVDASCIRYADASKDVSADKVIDVRIYGNEGKELSKDGFSTTEPYHMVLDTEKVMSREEEQSSETTTENSTESEGNSKKPVSNISYDQIKSKNALKLADFLGKDIDKSIFKKDTKYDGKHRYWQILDITLADGMFIDEKEILDQKNHLKKIAVKDIKEIRYYAAPFYYWKQIPDFLEEYGNLESLLDTEFQTYIYDKEGKKVKKKKKPLRKSMIDSQYYSLTGKQGDILGQSVASGEKFNSNSNSDFKIYVTGQTLLDEGQEWNQFTGMQLSEQFLQRLENCDNVSVEILNPIYQDNVVESIAIYEKAAKNPDDDSKELPEEGTTEEIKGELLKELVEKAAEDTDENLEDSEEQEEFFYFKDNVIIEITCSQDNN